MSTKITLVLREVTGQGIVVVGGSIERIDATDAEIKTEKDIMSAIGHAAASAARKERKAKPKSSSRPMGFVGFSKS